MDVLRGPIVFGTGGDKRRQRQIAEAQRAGRLRRGIRGVYTTEVDTSDEEVVRRHCWTLLGALYPEAVVGFRTASKLSVSPDEILRLPSEIG